MPTLEVIELYPSPFSDRLRWVLELKRVPYRRTAYVPLAGEAAHRERTGLDTAPVLIADGEVIGDSDRAVDWVEARHPDPPLLPGDPRQRAQVRAWELVATGVLGPAARLVLIGTYKVKHVQPLADHFAAKYHWSVAEEQRADRLLRTLLPDLAAAVATAPYLVGDAFTRADLTVAALLTPVLGLPPDDLFAIDASLRSLFGTALAADPAVAPLHEWRNHIYRQHRGGRVEPAPS